MMTLTVPSHVQPIAGVVPAEIRETTVMIVWPSVAKFGLGRELGKFFALTLKDQ